METYLYIAEGEIEKRFLTEVRPQYPAFGSYREVVL